MLEKLINSKTRLAILSLFFQNKDKEFYAQEIINQLGIDPANCHKELANLLAGGFLLVKNKSSRKYFCLNKDSIFYEGLEKLFAKYNIKNDSEEWVSLEEIPNYYPMMVSSVWNVKNANNFLKSRGLKNKFFKLLNTFDDNMNNLLVVKKEFDILSHEILDKCRKDPAWGQKYVEDLGKEEQNLIKATQELEQKNLGAFSNEELFKIFDKYYKVYENLHIFHWIQTIADFGDNIFSKYLMKYLRGKIRDTKYTLGETFSILTTPTKESLPTTEYKDLLHILEYILSSQKLTQYFTDTEVRLILQELPNLDKELNKKIDNHVSKYSFLGYGTIGPAWGKDYFVDILGSLVRQKANPHELLQKIKVDKQSIERKQAELIANLKIDKKHQDLFDVARGIIFTKGSRKEAMFYSYKVSENLFREIGRRFFLSVNQVRFLHPFEFKYLLLEGEFSAAMLNDRYKFSLHFSTGDMEKDDKMLLGDEARDFLSTLNIIKEDIGNKKMLEGDCASPGQAQGEIKIINVVSDMAKMKDGNVLVSIATNPDLVPAIKKASAIITDIGGITCHAAIVSRELGIPCVIGTKIATKLFKDGDIVTVDATHGKINILKSAK